MELARRAFNDAGGLGGRKLQVRLYDDEGKSEEAASTITKLITQDHVLAVIGEVASTRSIAMAPIAQRYKVPLVSPSSTNPRVTELGDYIFRVCFIDPFQGPLMAKFASETLHAKTAAILREYEERLFDWPSPTCSPRASPRLAVGLSKTRPTPRTMCISNRSSPSLKNLNPDVIYVPGYYTEVGLIARQARELAWPQAAPLLGGDGWDSPKLLEIGGEALNGSYFSNQLQRSVGRARSKRFRRALQSRLRGRARCVGGDGL